LFFEFFEYDLFVTLFTNSAVALYASQPYCLASLST